MKKFCTIQHRPPGGPVDAEQIFWNRPADIKAAKAFWSKCVDGKQPRTKAQEWNWVWP